MTLTVEDDFRDFVVACWPDLESAAMLVTLDADAARRVTTDALAGLHRQWREALDEGVPGALARQAVLTAAVVAARPQSPGDPVANAPPSGGMSGEDTEPAPDEEPGDPVVLALVDVLRGATPLQRAVLAGDSVWSLLPAEVAALLEEPLQPVVQASSSLRAALVTAHDAARAAEGLAPAGWSLDRDLDDALGLLLEGQGEPPDPAALVDERRRTVRRRSLVAGGAATLAAGGAAWWLLRDGTGVPGAPQPPATTPGPNDVSWIRAATWPARGDLAADPGVQALVLSRTTRPSRLVWADDVGGRRVVVSAIETSAPVGTTLHAWQGPRGADAGALEDVPLTLSTIEGVRDVVAITLPNGPDTDSSRTSLLVVLAHPTEGHASYSTHVKPTPEGRVERRWTQLPLQDGLAATVVNRRLSPATRLRVGAYDGPPATPDPLWLGGGSAGGAAPGPFAAAVHAYVERATGIPAWRLRTEVVADSPVNGSVLDPVAVSATGGDGRVVALLTRTPGGGALSSVIVTDDGRGGGNTAVVRPVLLLPADRADDPVLERVGDERDGVARFLVVAPGAARVQLLSTSPSAYPASKVTATKGGAAAVVSVVNGGDAAAFRVVARDAAGRVLFDDVPAYPHFLLDLWSGS